jgi:conserved protein with predicted RNA binding PUA domain
MSTECLQNSHLRRARVIAEYQFGEGVGDHLFPDACTFQFSNTGRMRQILYQGERLATLRARDGRLTLSYRGAQRLVCVLPAPDYRVQVREDITSFILQGKDVFAKHVIFADDGIRAEDEVLVTGEHDALLATGQAVLGGSEMLAFKYGVAVKVRQGRESACFQEE